MRLQVLAGELLLRALGSTWRIERHGEDVLESARRTSPRGNVIFAFWHSALLILAASHRNRGIHVLVSHHRDGEWIARILERSGYGLVRGSSRKGGVEALFRLANVLEEGHDVAVTVDGPLGPRYHVHPGVALLARRSGRPIVPVVVGFEHGRELPTWDALRLPDPRSRVRVSYEPPLQAAADRAAAQVAILQRRLEAHLSAGTQREEERFGRHPILEDLQDRRSFWERVSERDAPPAILRGAARVHAAVRVVERRLRPRPRGRGGRPWVVGVGNLEAGGTGKTPCVILLATALERAGLRVAVLTRGHRGALGARPEEVTAANLQHAADETRLLRAHLPGSIRVLVARDKRSGWQELRQSALDVVLVDDAFQTPRLPVDRHLVLLDWEQPFGNGFLLPAGRLRDRPATLARAHAVLLTRSRGNALPDLRPYWRGESIFRAEERFDGIRTPRGIQLSTNELRGVGVALICGLGRPHAFERLAAEAARRTGMRIRRRVRVGDHAPLEPELRKLVSRLEALDCSYVLTTEKDLERLDPAAEWNEPLLVLEQRLEIPDLERLLALLVPDSYVAKSAKFTDSDVRT